MRELSFVFPARIDNNDRLNNLDVSLGFMHRNFPDSEFIVIEDDKYSKIESVRKQYNDINFYFLNNTDRLSKSNTLNSGLLKSTRDYVVIYDLDVLINPESIHQAYKILKRGTVKVILPHNTIMVNVKGETKQKFIETYDFNRIPYIKRLPLVTENPDLKAYPIPSGVVIYDRRVLLYEGGFNKRMVSYSWEDIEVIKRLNKLGYYFYTMGKYNVIHLDHARGIDSHANEYTSLNEMEYYNMLSMSRKKLRKYIDTELTFNENFSKQERRKFRRSVYLRNILTLYFIRHYLNRLHNFINIYGIISILKWFVNSEFRDKFFND